MKKFVPDGVACAVIVAIALLLYRKVVRLWWMYDDAIHLQILRHATLPQLLTHERGPLFTPLLMLSLKCDLALFGLDAGAFYIHQLISLSALMIAFYVLLRFWCSPLAAAAAVMVGVTGGPMLQMVPLLMTRHYIEGAIWALVATILFVAARRRDSLPLAIASAIVYLAAAVSKEIFVGLPALLFVLPDRSSWRGRTKLLIPHALAAVTYAAWRIVVVGVRIASYGPSVGDRWRVIATLPIRIIRYFAGSGSSAAWILTALILIVVTMVLIRMPEARLPAIAGVTVSILPILPVATALEPRMTFAFWLLAVVAIAFAPQVVPRGGAALSIVLVIAALAAFRAEWPATYRRLLRMSDEARVLTILGPYDIVHNPLTPPTTMLDLKNLFGTQARAIYDELPLCDPAWHAGRIFEYDASRHSVIETDRRVIDRACASIAARPMRVRISYDTDGAMHWTLQPYSSGTWTLILVEGIVTYDVPAQGGFRWEGLEHLMLRVRYQSPAGWRTYSPLLAVDRRNPPLEFNRP